MTRRQRKNLIRIGVSAALLAVFLFLPVKGALRLFLFLIPYLVSGWDVLWKAARNLAGGQLMDENFLMALATAGALILGEYPEAVAVMVFYQVGEWFQSVAVGRSRKSIQSLMDIRPDEATVLRDGAEQTVSPEEVHVGEVIVVRPGERVPLDGVIVSGQTSLDLSALTGESKPTGAGEGERVLSGSVNLSGVISVRTESEFAESTVSRILELVENASSRKSKAENFITRFARVYTPCVVAGAILLALVPPLVFGESFSKWAESALIFLVVSCPCALVVSVPLSFFGGLGGASKEGILIKGSNYMETLSKIRTVVFDKTGTLTRGVFKVTKVLPRGVSDGELLELAALIEAHSNHPAAQSIRAAYESGAFAHRSDGTDAALKTNSAGADAARAWNVTERAGLGVEAVMDGKRFFAGSARLLESVGILVPNAEEVGTVVHLARENEYLGCIVVFDEIKPGAREAVEALRHLGVTRLALLTGDTLRAGEDVKQKLKLDEAHCGLLPADKVEKVEEYLKSAPPILFAGDGNNDAPVIARADIGVAMGALGSDAAIEAADVVLMDDEPGQIARAVQIARRTMAIVRQNIAFALAVKAGILILGAIGRANMWLAVFADVGVLVLATANAMRALRFGCAKL